MSTPTEVKLAAALAEARQAIAHEGTGYVPPWAGLTDAEREQATMEAGLWLAALARITDVWTEDGCRTYVDGEVIDEDEMTLDRARTRVRRHAEKRRANPDWRGNAEVLRRTCYVTPWEVVASSAASGGPVRQRAEDVTAASQPCGADDCQRVRAMHDDGGPCATPECGCPRWRSADAPVRLAEFGDTLTEEERADWTAALNDARGRATP